MRSKANANSSEADVPDELARRRVPCMIAFLQPFRLVDGPAASRWKATISHVNRRNWDYVELHKMVGGIDVGLTPPFHMVVFRDGAIALPVLPDRRTVTESVEFINRNFSALLLGGIYCEMIGLDGLDFGSIIDWKYLRVLTSAPAAANRFHYQARMRLANPLEAINLLKPKTVDIDELSSAMSAGRKLLEKIPELAGEFLLKGVTSLVRHDWGGALSNLWIVTEQVTTNIWKDNVLGPARSNSSITGRVDQLSDTRTWTTATRHELLHQIGIIGGDLLANLATARRARNALAHRGTHPTSHDSRAAYDAVLGLLQVVAKDLPVPLSSLRLAEYSLPDPFSPPPLEPKVLKPTHWMEIPKLPGEAELERLEASSRSPTKSRRRSKHRNQ